MEGGGFLGAVLAKVAREVSIWEKTVQDSWCLLKTDTWKGLVAERESQWRTSKTSIVSHCAVPAVLTHMPLKQHPQG